MNKLYKILAGSLFICCAITLTAEENVKQEQNEKLEKYVSAEKGYSIDYPSDWTKSDVPQLDLVLFAPTKGANENAHASMNIVSEKVGNGITLDQFYSESAANLTSALKDVQVQKTGSSQLNGVTSKWMLYTHTMQNVKFRVLQYFIVAQETIYLITFSSASDDFENYRQDFENIANTFKITAPAATPKSTTTPAPAATPTTKPAATETDLMK